ncbi:MAG TPA: sensor histidine kinase, partial [Candidatus Saccharimonadales bacterium]|nr:sensor histidine kinase [Candidatus Saccharimonadales bacterium]
YLDSSGILESTTFPTGSPVGLLLIPVLYSALRYGLAGSAATAAWATLLWLPDLLLPDALGHPASDLIDLAIVDAVAIFVGERVERTRIQHRRADAAEEERREAELRYRELFQTNFFPILIVDEDGVIIEANPAAAAAFGDRVTGRTTQTALGIPRESLCRQTEASIQSVDSGDGTIRTYRLRVARVRPGGENGRDFQQLVFQDLTEEYRDRAATRSYAARLMAAQEEERRHIAHEIHDDPLQRLIHLARRMDSLVTVGGPGPASKELLETRVELLEIIGRLRDVTRGLRPPGLDQLGLVAAVRGLLADVEDAHALRVDFEVTGTPMRLAADAELGAFRIIQEAASNVIRHASAHVARVDLQYDEDSLRIRVVDDGIGFDTRPGVSGGGAVHLGLDGMRERANLLGGRLVVSSEPGKGTAIEASLPARPPAMSVAG